MAANPFFGRAAELRDLKAAFDDARRGRGSIFFLSGEPGIGKTRLATELAGHASGAGAAVHWGCAWEADGAPSCWPWVQVLRSCAATPGGEALIRSATDLSILLPELGAAPAAIDPDQTRFRLGCAVISVLEGLCARTPQLLIFDDLHGVDASSLALLQLLSHEARRLRLLVVGTYRDVEARQAPEVSAALARIARAGRAQPLGPLDQPTVAHLVEASFGRPVSAEIAASVFRATEGNPLFVDSVSRLLASRGQGAVLPAGFALPDTVRETLLQRLALLSDRTRELLAVASVLGRDFSSQAVVLAAGTTIEEVLGAIAEGAAAGCLAAEGPTRFAHVLVREALYQGLPMGRRVELHGHCATALEQLYRGDPEAHLAQLAHHFVQAAPLLSWQRAHDYSARAGARSLELLAFDDAISHLGQAVQALDQLPQSSAATRAELLCRLGEAKIRGGHPSAGKEDCRRAAELARGAGAPPVLARAALALGAELTVGRPNPELAAAIEAALAALGSGEGALRAQLLARGAAALMPSPNPEPCLAMARQAVAEARALGDPRVLARVISSARAVFTPNDDLAERISLDTELASLGRQLGAKHLALQAHERLVVDSLEQGEPAAVEAQLAECDRLSQELGHPLYQWRTAVLKVTWATLRGRAQEAERLDALARALISRLEDQRPISCLEALRFQRARLANHPEEAAAAVAAFELDVASDAGRSLWAPIFRAMLLVQLGRVDEASAALARGMPPTFADLQRAGVVVAFLAEIFLAAGDRPRLEESYALLGRYGDRNLVAPALLLCVGPGAYLLGRIAAALGRKEDARRHFQAALTMAERTGAEPWGALAQLQLGAPVERRAEAPAPELRLAREADLWVLTWGGETVRLKHAKGLTYLAELVRGRGRELHVTELLALGEEAGPEVLSEGGLSVGGLGDAGELLDAKARAAYRRRLEELDETLREAEAFGDRERAARAREEREALAQELARAVGLGGRDRRAADSAERARINVQRRLRGVLEKIREASPALGRHLEAFVRTGSYCAYRA